MVCNTPPVWQGSWGPKLWGRWNAILDTDPEAPYHVIAAEAPAAT